MELTQFQLILRLLEKSAFLCEHLVAKYIQDYQKPDEVRIETPCERWQRENNKEPADGEVKEERKEKTPEEIRDEKESIHQNYTAAWEKAKLAHQEVV